MNVKLCGVLRHRFQSYYDIECLISRSKFQIWPIPSLRLSMYRRIGFWDA